MQYSNVQRPYKVWSSDRQTRKSITASNLNEFKLRAAEKLGYKHYSNLKVVLEEDGTEVEDEAYFQSAEKDTVFLLLRDKESWLAPGIDALKSGETGCNHWLSWLTGTVLIDSLWLFLQPWQQFLK